MLCSQTILQCHQEGSEFDPSASLALDETTVQLDCSTIDDVVDCGATTSDKNDGSFPGIRVSHLSDDSDTEDEEDGTRAAHSREQSSTGQDASTKCPMRDVQLSQKPNGDEGSKSEQKRNLTEELFGDFDDNLSHLSVSDSSSCCSESSLGSVDDLADLLCSDVQEKGTIKLQDSKVCSLNIDVSLGKGYKGEDLVVLEDTADKVLSNKPEIICCTDEGNEKTCTGEQASAKVDGFTDHCFILSSSPLSCESDQEELRTTHTADVVTLDSGAVSHQQELSAIEGQSHLCVSLTPTTVAAPDMGTGDSGTLSTALLCEDPSVILPNAEVEADTASCENSDCEMDVSFSTLFGDDFQAISPLPPSPLNSHVCCFSTPLSPLPHLLSPLPQTPHQDLVSVSPLLHSPIDAHQRTTSPLPPPPTPPLSPNRAHRDVTSVDSELSGESCRGTDASPVQFDDAAPSDVHVPKPCCISISVDACSEGPNSTAVVGPCAVGDSDVTSPKKRKLRLSETSPFSPPLACLLPTSAEAVPVFSAVPMTVAAAATAASETKPISSSSPPRLLPVSAEVVPVFEAVPLTVSSATPAVDRGSVSTSCDSEIESFVFVDDLEAIENSDDQIKSTDLVSELKSGEESAGNVAESSTPARELAVRDDVTKSVLSVTVSDQEKSGDRVTNFALQISELKKPEDITKSAELVSEPAIKEKLDDRGESIIMVGGDMAVLMSELEVVDSNKKLTVPFNEVENTDDATKSAELVRELEKTDEATESTELVRELEKTDELTCVSESAKAAPSSSNCDGSSKSPVEEGEISDSDEDENELPSKEKDEQTLKRSPALPQVTDTSVVPSHRAKSNSDPPAQQGALGQVTVHHQPPFPAQISPTRTSVVDGNSQAVGDSPKTTFDELLNTFCSKTKTKTRKRGKVAKLLQSSPEKPAPLARLLSVARSKPKKHCQASKPQAAAFIGVQSTSNLASFPYTDHTGRNTAQTGTKSDQCVPREMGGQSKVVKRLEKVISTEETQPPANKRPKIQTVDDEVRVPSELKAPGETGRVADSNSPLVATPFQSLPGYKLRSRNVEVSQWWPRKRKTSSGEDEQPTKKKQKKKTGRPVHVGPKVDKTAKSEPGSANLIKMAEDIGALEKQDILVGVSGLVPSEDSATEHCPSSSSSSQTPLFENSNEVRTLDDEKPPSLELSHGTAATTVPPSSAVPATSHFPQPAMTSILADSDCIDMSGDSDSDQPLMIGDLESLLDSEIYESTEQFALPSTLPPALPPSPRTSRSVRPKPLVRKTDSATGQEEDQTPTSSPKTGTDVISKHLLSLSEQKRVGTSNITSQQPSPSSPSLTTPAAAATTSAAVGYGQLQQAPLPKYSPLSTSQGSKDGPSSSLLNVDDDDVFSTPLPLLDKSGSVHQSVQPGSSQGAGVSLAQQELTVCMQSPLPLPQWLVAAMTRVQSKHEHCAASGMGLSKKKRGNGE